MRKNFQVEPNWVDLFTKTKDPHHSLKDFKRTQNLTQHSKHPGQNPKLPKQEQQKSDQLSTEKTII